MLLSNQCPAALKTAWETIKKHLNLGNLDLVAPAEGASLPPPKVGPRASCMGNLDEDIYQVFIAGLSTFSNAPLPYAVGKVLLLHQWQVKNILYTNFSASPSLSVIYYHPDLSRQSGMVPAQIHTIFLHKRCNNRNQLVEETFFAVHDYRSSSENAFAPFPNYQAAIFFQEPDQIVKVIQEKQLHCLANQG